MNSGKAISGQRSAVSRKGNWSPLGGVGLAIAMIFGGCADSLAQEPAATSQQTVARLVTDLASDSRAIRAAAEAELVRSGPAVIEFLPVSAAVTDPGVRDTLDRVVRTIELAESAAALTPKKVNWSGTKSLTEAIDQLSTSTGNSIDCPLLDQISITSHYPVEALTFWEAIGWLEQNTPLRWESGHLTRVPTGAASPPPPLVSLSGPFRVELLEHSLRTTPSGLQLLGIKLRTTCEPRLKPLFLVGGIDDWEISRDGASCLAFTPHARREIPGGKSGVIDVAFDFILPDSVAETQNWTLKGHVDLTLAARSTRVTFSDLTAKLPLTRRRGQASLSLLSVKSTETSCTVRIASAFPEMSGLFESYRASLLAPDLSLEQPEGNRLSPVSIAQIQEDPNGIVIETRFDAPPTAGTRLHAQVPTAISTQKIPFEFSKLTLSSPK